jgi:hypothetical protein
MRKSKALLLLAAPALVIGLAACNTGQVASQKAAASPTSPAKSAPAPAPTPAPTPAPKPPAKTTFTFGSPVTITDEGQPQMSVTVSAPVFGNTDSEGKAMVVVDVTIHATGKGPVDYNPLDWYIRGADGTHYDGDAMPNFESSTGQQLDDQSLHSGTLNPGEKVRGYLLFSAPVTSGSLVFNPSAFSSSVAEWPFS